MVFREVWFLPCQQVLMLSGKACFSWSFAALSLKNSSLLTIPVTVMDMLKTRGTNCFSSKTHYILVWESGVGSTNSFMPSPTAAVMVLLHWSHLGTPWDRFSLHIHHIFFSQVLLFPSDKLNGLCTFCLGSKTFSWPQLASPGTHTLPGPGSLLALDCQPHN